MAAIGSWRCRSKSDCGVSLSGYFVHPLRRFLLEPLFQQEAATRTTFFPDPSLFASRRGAFRVTEWIRA